MSSKILLPQLVTMLAASTGNSKKNAEAFVKAFFGTLTDTLSDHENVKIKGFGTFKVNRVESRKSVNVSTGNAVQIPAHYKIVFNPDKALAEKVNREFSWLEIVELTEDSTATEIPQTPTPAPMVAPVMAITEKQEEESEHLGEELEQDFGNIEPVEPFGPVDPEDPEPGEPITEDTAAPASAEPADPPQEELEMPATAGSVDVPPEETAMPTTAEPADVPQVEPEAIPIPSELPADFDPYAVDVPAPLVGDFPKPVVEDELPPQPASPYYITKEEYDSLASKSDLKTLNRNLKRIRTSVEKLDEKNKKRSRNAIIWSVIISAALLTGGLFLLYGIMVYKFHRSPQPRQEIIEKPIAKDTYEEEEEEYTDLDTMAVTIAGLELEKETTPEPETKEEKKEDRKEPATKEKSKETASANTAPTHPSDIKAMDKVTTTRYLTTMAKEHYGNYNLWPYIYIENEGKLGHPDRITPGTTIVIPNIEKYGINPSNPKDIEKARKLGVEIYRKYAQ